MRRTPPAVPGPSGATRVTRPAAARSATAGRSPSLLVVQLERQEPVRVGAARAQCGGDHGGAREVLLRRAGLLRLRDVTGQAVGALGGRRDGDRDELTVADAQHLVLRVEDRTVERLERLDGSARGLPQLPQVRPVARLVEVLEVRTLLGDLVRQEAV